MVQILNKIKNKKGGTQVIEILITIPIIICVLFLPISSYQVTQQENYIEDVKTRMVQQMSRNGELNSSDVSYWKGEFEKYNGIKVISIPTVSKTYRDDGNGLMSTTLMFKLKPSIFSMFFGGNYQTKAIIYSEAIRK